MEAKFEIESEFKADILNFSLNSIFAFDFKKEVYWISNTLNNGIVKKIAINISKHPNKISLCKSRAMFAYIEMNENNIQVVDAQQSKIIANLSLSDSKIESVNISDSGDSILIGGKNGVLSKWDIYSKKLLGIINRHKDFILLARESPNKRFILSVGYDRSIMLFDNTKDKIGSLIGVATSTIMCARFIKDSTLLVLGDMSGFIYVIDTNTKLLLYKFQAGYIKILDIAYYKDSFLFVLNSNHIISVFDFSTQEKILDNLLNKPCLSFLIENDLIITADNDNKILAYSFEHFISHCTKLINEAKIAEAYKFINQFAFLKAEDFYITLEARFNADILKAKAFACSKNQTLAIEILNQYADIPLKEKIVLSLINEIKMIDEFESLMKSGLEVRAMPLTQKYPLLKELRSYMSFEAKFSKIILLAKELIKKNKKNDANTIIMQYKRFPLKAAAIQEVFLYPHKVDEAIRAINNRDYKTYFKLKKEYKFVSSLNGAREIEQSGEIMYYKCLEAFYSLKLKEAQEYIQILRHFSEYRDFALSLELKIADMLEIIAKIN